MPITVDIGQSRAALRIANTRRIAAAEYKRQVAEGKIPIGDAIRNCDHVISILQLLTSAPRVGAVRAESILTKTERLLESKHGGQFRLSLDYTVAGSPCYAGGDNSARGRTRSLTPREREALATVAEAVICR